MKKIFLFFGLGILLVVFQASLLARLFPFIPRPNLLLIVLVYLSQCEDAFWIPLWVAGVGLFFDALSGGPFGLFTLVFVAVYVVMRGAAKAFLLVRPSFRAGAVLAAHLLQGGFLLGILSFLGFPFPGDYSRLIQFIVCSLIGSLLSLPLFVILERIEYAAAVPRPD